MSANELQPVVRRQDRLSPKKREEVRDDPSIIHADSREALTTIDHLRLIPAALDPDTPISMVLDIRKELRQTANVDPKAAQGPVELPTFIINFGGTNDAAPFTIDVQPPAPVQSPDELDALPTVNTDLTNGFFSNADPA